MAIIVRLEHEMPPCVIPPYTLDGENTVREALEAACQFFKREPNESQLIEFETGIKLSDLDLKLKEYGLGHWSLMELRSTVNKHFKRVTFG